MKNWIRIVISVIFLWVSTIVSAQENIAMADKFRQEGKIYVVVAVVLIILIGIFISLFKLEKKIKKLEEEIN